MDTYVPKFCGKCGEPLLEASKFCTECGFPINFQKAIASDQKGDQFNDSATYRIKRQKISRKKKIGILALVAFISAISIGMLGITAEDKNPSQYEGLTNDQTLYVRYIEDECKRGAQQSYALGGVTAQEAYTERCNGVVESAIRNAKYENTVKLSIEQDDYTLCNNVDDNLLCIRDYALATNKPEICTKTEHVQESCILDIVKKYNDIKACDMLEDNTNCVSYFVAKNNDPKICESATDKQQCLSGRTYSVGISACNLLEEDRIEGCQKDYFEYVLANFKENISDNDAYKQCIGSDSWIINQASCRLEAGKLALDAEQLLSWKIADEPKICSFFNFPQHLKDEGKAIDYCIASVGAFTKDLSTCDKSGSAKVECYGSIARVSDIVDIEECNTLQEDVGGFCLSSVAFRTQDSSICEHTVSSNQDLQNSFISNCKMMIEKGKTWSDNTQ